MTEKLLELVHLAEIPHIPTANILPVVDTITQTIPAVGALPAAAQVIPPISTVSTVTSSAPVPMPKVGNGSSNLNTVLVIIFLAAAIGGTAAVIYYVNKPKTDKNASDKK